MIDFRKHGIDYDEYTSFEIKTNDLIALGNVGKKICETKVLNDNNENVVIEGKYQISNVNAIIGGEIIYVKTSSLHTDEQNTVLEVDRALKGTTREDWTGYNFRTVVLIDEFNSDTDLLDWNFEDTLGSVSNTLFPVELGSGSITFKSDLSLWSPTSIDRKYRVRNRKSVAYIFKGVGDKRFLKFTTIITKLGVNTRGKSDPNRVRLDIKTKLATWYEKDLSINKQLKSVNPKVFFMTIFGLKEHEVYYANGVDDDSFLKINNLHTKEYNKVSEILKAYCSNGIRFCLDRFERVKIFSDFKIDNIQSQKTIKYDLTDSTLNEDEAMIYNTINTQAIQRLTMFNFEDLDNKYVMFPKVLRDAVLSDRFIKREPNGDLIMNILEISSEEVHNHVQIGDLLCFKSTGSSKIEINATVIDKQSGHKVIISPLNSDKDYRIFPRGKSEYLYNILNNNIVPFDLYYGRQELPMVFKFSRKKGDEVKDASLMYPILPKVNGEVVHRDEISIEFGCMSKLKVGSYTGIIEEIDKIFGIWESDKLLYNREIDQFSNTDYPPIFVLSNKVNERKINEKHTVINYTHFDNSNFQLEVNPPTNNKSDAVLGLVNTQSVNKDIDLYVDTEISRRGKYILEIGNVSQYKLGDVLILNRPDDLTPQEETEFDETLKNIKWIVVAKTTETNESGETKSYIQVDSPFAKRQSKGKKYSFTRYPNWSIVYLQELYFRGNPVIEFKQDVTGVSKGVNIDGEKSVSIYGEKKYEFDSKQLTKEDMKMFMGYILDHFQSTDLNSTKFNVPISIFNGIDIELLDVITILDPNRTMINENNKWVVLSISNKSKTNVVQMKLLNINKTNTKPFKIEIKDVLEYKPVDLPLYDNTGSEGTGGENDGTGGEGENKALGQFNMAEVDVSKFRAKVDRFVGSYIYFKDFEGEEWETYVNKLFPKSEFGVTIGAETIFVQSDSNYRAFIKKRDVYNVGDLTTISPEMDVKFLTITSFTDIDGKFNSRGCYIGDGNNYFSFDIINGAKFVGDFVVGEENKHEGNDLWQSLQKNRTFQQDEAPVSTQTYMLRVGDIWYDTNDEQHCYRYNGDVWVSCRDKSIISTKSSTFIQPNEPVSTEGKPIKEGDTWYDTSRDNRPHIYKNGQWVNVSDTSFEAFIDEVQKEVDKTNQKLSDMSDDNKLTPPEKQETKKEWEIIKGEFPKIKEEALKFSVNTSVYQLAYENLKNYIEPTLVDMDIFSDIQGEVYRNKFKDYYDNRQDVLNGISSKAKEIADGANEKATTALGNSKIFRTPTEPTEGMKINDMWYDTDDGNHPYIYTSSGWVSARDKVYETEGGNKVFFQDTEPPTYEGVKDGDMWFKTNENNKLFILTKNQWVVADDSLDKIMNGRVVINANTTFNGDATIVSQGTDETTIIKGGSVTFTRNGIPITTFRNMRLGSVTTDGNGKGFVDFTGMKQDLMILPSIKAFNVTANVRSLNCRVEKDPTHLAENRYKFFIYGTEEIFEGAIKVDQPSLTYSVVAYSAGVEGITLSINKIYSSGSVSGHGIIRNLSHTVTQTAIIAVKCYIDNEYYGEVDLEIPSSYIQVRQVRVGYEYGLSFNNILFRLSNFSKTTKDKVMKTIRIEYRVKRSAVINTRFESSEYVGSDFADTDWFWKSLNHTIGISDSDVRYSMVHYFYSPSFIQNILGDGEVQYIAIEQ